MSEPAMTEAQLSKGSGAAPEFIRRLIGLGIVPSRDGERPFVLGDIHRVRLAQAFERSGISLQAIGTAIASGHLSFDFVDQIFIYHAPLTGKTFREIAEDLDLPLETLTRLYAMWGLPRPAPDDVVREDDAATFSPWKAVFSPELLNERLLTHGPVVPGRDRPPGLVGQLQQHRHQPGRGAATTGHLHRRGARPVAVAGAALRPPG